MVIAHCSLSAHRNFKQTIKMLTFVYSPGRSLDVFCRYHFPELAGCCNNVFVRVCLLCIGHMSRPPHGPHDTLSRSVTRPHDSRDVTDAGQMLPSQASPTHPSVPPDKLVKSACCLLSKVCLEVAAVNLNVITLSALQKLFHC